MTLLSSFVDPPFRISIALAEYPILQDRIREKMREEMFARGVISDDEFNNVVFNRAFFYETPNHLVDYLPEDRNLSKALRLIMVEDYRPNHSMNLVMDSNAGQAIAYLVPANLTNKEPT
jgi:hypothetical protein